MRTFNLEITESPPMPSYSYVAGLDLATCAHSIRTRGLVYETTCSKSSILFNRFLLPSFQ